MRYIAKRPLQVDKGDRILVRANNWIGDVILVTPVLNCIRKSFPDAQISILAKPWVIPVLAYNPHIDEIIRYDRNSIHKGLAGIWRVSQSLKAKGFKIAILLQRAFEAALIAYLARIPSRVGYSSDGRGLLLTHRVTSSREEFLVPRVEHNLKLIEGFGLLTNEKDLVLKTGQESIRQAEQRLLSLGIRKEDRLFGISPGSAGPVRKRWYPDRFADVAARIAKAHNAKGIIFGALHERDVGAHIVSEASVQGMYSLAGETTLDETIALIAHCSLFISNDSGLMHVAAALDVPMAAIFGPSDFRTTSPWCKRYILVRKEDLDCSPCLRKNDCSYDHRCMKEISAGDVFQAIEGLIERYGFDTLGQRSQHLVPSNMAVPVV